MPDIGRDLVSYSQVFADAGFTSGQIVFMGASGVLTKDADFTYDPSTKLLTVGGNVAFKSGTSFKGTFDHANTVDRVYTLPNYDGTLATLAGIEVFTNKTIDADLNTITNIENADIKAGAAIAYSKLNLTGSIINVDVNTAAGIVYSKLVLTGSIVDSDIAGSGITTRSKLPSLIAYEDEVNAFTQTQTFSNATAIAISVNKFTTSQHELYEFNSNTAWLLRATGTNQTTRIYLMPNGTNKTSEFALFADDNINLGSFRVLSLNSDGSKFIITSNRTGASAIFALDLQINGSSIITLNNDDTVNDNSRTHNNFVAASPSFSGSISGSPTITGTWTWSGAIVIAPDIQTANIKSSDGIAAISITTITAAMNFNNRDIINARILSSELEIRNPANTFSYILAGSAITADRTLAIPLLTGNDTLAVLGLAQTFTVGQTISVSDSVPFTIEITNATSTRATQLDTYGANSVLSQRRANGTKALPTAVLNGELVGSNRFSAYDGAAFQVIAEIRANAEENITSLLQGSSLRAFVTGVGTATNQEEVRIHKPTGLPAMIAIRSGSRIQLDGLNGLGNTFFVEGAADRIDVVAGGAIVVDFTSTDLDVLAGKRIDYADSQTTVGAAGAASALPANPTGYILVKVAGTERVIPFYAQA